MPVQWINSFRMSLTTFASYIPLIATVVTCFFSVILARATLRYVEATDKGLNLAREEFEREWTPDLHIKLERISSSEARVVVTNLARSSVLLQLLQLRKLSHAMPFERCRLNDPLVGGMTWSQEMGKRILACTDQNFEGPIAASITFRAAVCSRFRTSSVSRINFSAPWGSRVIASSRSSTQPRLTSARRAE